MSYISKSVQNFFKKYSDFYVNVRKNGKYFDMSVFFRTNRFRVECLTVGLISSGG